MKLVRWGEPGMERPGVIDARGAVRDLSATVDDVNGEALGPDNLARIAGIDHRDLPVVQEPRRLGPCVGGVGKIVGVGLNYREHVSEAGAEVPTEPIIFLKATTALAGPYDNVRIPRGSTKTDWEIELCLVIGTRATYVAEREALAHVAGYCVANDVSEREYQLERGGQWVKGKSFDTFAPIGPWLVTRDDVSDPHDLDMYLYLGDRKYQSANTRDMIFGVPALVSYISSVMTLEPGDLIFTGTPPGVGMGQNPPIYLRPGDVMRLGITGLGEQRSMSTGWNGQRS